MFNLKRLWMVLSSALTLGVAGVLVLAGTAPGASAIRSAATHLTVAAHASGGGAPGGAINVTIAPTASLTARLAVTVSVSYTCQPVFNPITMTNETVLSSGLSVSVQQRQGKIVAHGFGFSNGTAICDNTFVNHASVVVVPDIYPGFTSSPFKKGAALATVNASACSAAVVSGPFGACDFGSAGPMAISIK
jgi:hypothetical protein